MKRFLAMFPLGLILITAGCGSDNPAAPKAAAFSFGFETDLEGWSTGTTSNGWGSVTWSDRGNGIVHFDGTGGPGDPNSWIYKELTLPGDVTKVTYEVSGHDRRNGDSAFRIRVEDGGVSTTIHDWEVIVGGTDGEFNFMMFTDDISAFAGKTVTLYVEQDDDGDGTDEHIYLESLTIR